MILMFLLEISQIYLSNKKNIYLEYGKDNDGNLFSYNNFCLFYQNINNELYYR